MNKKIRVIRELDRIKMNQNMIKFVIMKIEIIMKLETHSCK